MSNKMPLAWHKKNLRNGTRTLKAEERRLEELKGTVKRMREDMDFRIRQIEEAERRGIDGFDADRFLAKERP